MSLFFLFLVAYSSRLFLLSLDNNKIQKLSTPTNLSSLTVPGICNKFYVPKFWNEDHAGYIYLSIRQHGYHSFKDD